MEHFTLENWADFARNHVPADAAGRMQQHLASGCPRCAESLEIMKKVAGFAAREAAYEPPVESVRSAKALLNTLSSGSKKVSIRDFMPMVFDSFAQPVAAGVRVALATSRQFLYRKGEFSVDIRLEQAAGAKEMILIGQVLNSGQHERGLGAILVELMTGEKVIAGATTTSFGEFQFLFPSSDDSELQLCVGISSQNCFWIKIPPLETIPESGLVVTD